LRPHTIPAATAGRDRMPRSWIYMMAVLIACLIASMVIAVIRLF
jgi:hypothetical protein